MKVTFSEVETAEVGGQVCLGFDLHLPETRLAGWPVKGKLVIKNQGSQSAFETNIKFVAHGVTLKSAPEINLGTIPPWSEKEIEFKLSSPLFEDSRGRVEVGVGYADFSGRASGEVLNCETHFIPFWRYLFSWWLLLPLGLGLLGFGTLKLLDIRERFG